MRTRAVAVISISVLLIVAATVFQLRTVIAQQLAGGPPKPIAGRAPDAIGRVWECPLGWPVKGFRPSGLYYPLDHPSAPDFGVKPARCFKNASGAESAGYHVAPPPPGVSLVVGVYFLPAPARVLDLCRRAAPQLGYAAPCPTLVPNGSGDSLCPVAGCGDPPGFRMHFIYATADAVTGQTRSVVIELTAAPLFTPAGQAITDCQRPIPGPQLFGSQSGWGTCTIGGNISLGWTAGPGAYQLLLNDSDPADRTVVEFLATALQPVS